MFDASASSDADIARADISDALTYSWRFSDGATATGRTATHAFARFGSYTATLTVTDAFGWPSAFAQTLTVGDVAPSVAPLSAASLIAGESYAASGSFGDPGNDVWAATVDYGDGSGAQPLSLSGKSFSLSHGYASAGIFHVTVAVGDDGGASGSALATVNVITPLAATQGLAQQVQLFVEAGAVALPQPLLASIDAAAKQVQRGNVIPAVNELDALANKIGAAVIAGRMSPDAAQQLMDTIRRIQSVLRA
jgi:hypothetical protein